MLKGLRLPEFDKSRNIEEQRALVFDAPCRYDVILGNDFFNSVGIDINGSNVTVEWLGNSIPMRAPPTPGEEDDFNAYAESLYVEIENEWLGFDPYKSYVSQILDAKYEKSDIEEIAAAQTHLTQDQRNVLRKLFKKHEKLFSGKLGLYPHKKFNIKLLPGSEPVQAGLAMSDNCLFQKSEHFSKVKFKISDM